MHIHISTHIHYPAYSLSCIFITIHINFYAYSFLHIFISLHIHILTSPYLYKLLPKPFDRQVHIDRERTEGDRHRQIHIYDYTRYYRAECWLYIDYRLSQWFYTITINAVIVYLCLVIISNIAKQYFTRLHYDSSK